MYIYNIYIHIYIYINVSVATDEGPSPKLALSEGGSRGNIEKLAANVIQTRPLQSPSGDLSFVVT